MSGTDTFLWKVESVTERILKTIKAYYICYSFAKINVFSKSSNDFEELNLYLQSTLETSATNYLLFYLNFTIS